MTTIKIKHQLTEIFKYSVIILTIPCWGTLDLKYPQ